MDIYKRVDNLENLVNSLINTINNSKFYTDADIAGVRKNIGDITPYTETKEAYIDDTEITFKDIPEGDMTVFVSDPAIEYSVTRENSYVTVVFTAPLEEVIEVTISVQ